MAVSRRWSFRGIGRSTCASLFTTECGRGLRAVTKDRGESAAASLLASQRREVIREIDDIVRGVDPNGSPSAKASAYCRTLRYTLLSTLGALSATVERLSGLEGRKILVYVSQGLPQTPGIEIWQYIDDVFKACPPHSSNPGSST